MDPELSETISKLKSEKRILANKLLLELSKFVKQSFAKIEKKMDDKFAVYEKRLEQIEYDATENYAIHDAKFKTHDDDIEDLKNDELKLSDDVSNLQTEHKNVSDKKTMIDDALQEINDKMKT